MKFTSALVTLMWKLKKALNITQGEAMKLAIEACRRGEDERVYNPTSIFGQWTHQATRALAGHCWGLFKAYSEVGATARAVAFKKASTKLYAQADEAGACSFSTVIKWAGFGIQILKELVSFYVAAHICGYTPRSAHLIMREGAWRYGLKVKLAQWVY